MGMIPELTIPPGTYPIYVEDDTIKFQIGKKRYSIYETYLMNNHYAPISCLQVLSKKSKIFPLKQNLTNRFTLGKFAEIEIIINFNYVKIRRNKY